MRPAVALLACATALTVASCGSSTASAAYDPDTDTSEYTHELGRQKVPEFYGSGYEDQVTLDDGRKVAIYVDQDVGLYEQHYSPTADAWSRPRLLFSTKEDTCQSPTLKTDGSTVAAIFDFGIYCYDGEPPEQSIVGVAVGDLQDWDLHLQERSDGYDKAAFSDDGATVTFTSNQPQEKVVWRLGDGIDDPID